MMYDLWYHVAHIDVDHKNMIEHAIRAAMLPSSEDTTEHARSQQPMPEKMKDGVPARVQASRCPYKGGL